MKKTCICCGIEKNISEFEHQKNRPNPRKKCKQCRYSERDISKENSKQAEYKKEYRIKNKERLQRNWEKAVYGITKDDFSYASCWICGSTKRLSIDNDHASGDVRGLLCSACNFGIGSFRDNVQNLKKAILYLQTCPHIKHEVT